MPATLDRPPSTTPELIAMEALPPRRPRLSFIEQHGLGQLESSASYGRGALTTVPSRGFTATAKKSLWVRKPADSSSSAESSRDQDAR